ncbi:MAG: glycosyltransferase family 39 protein [Bacteroidales bacterium]|nr:glycosyltransferase family 39 protein [Bacteroidales bacterium]MCF8349693.1 glycosyltransferase family 39 protein [Bacteroidales bacterium]MCF8376573.1 glycosyltransferase family 39 protein [Bacteroidales bacterium]
MNKTGSSKARLLFFFLIAALILKMFTFFYSVIDIDESTYLIIGKEVFNGNWLYVDYYDTKPPGIFLIFGLIEYLTGSGIFFSRLVASLLVGLSAFLLYKLKFQLSGNSRASIFTGLTYLILASMYRFTFAANTEVFFIFFTIWAFYIFFTGTKNSRFFIGGLIAGLGFMIKYVVAFDMLAYGLLLVFLVIKGRMKFLEMLKTGALILAGLLLPLAAVALVYLSIGQFDALLRFSFGFLMNYGQSSQINNYGAFLSDIHLKYLPAFLLFYFLLFQNVKSMLKEPFSFFKLAWVVMVFLSIFLLKRENIHYFMQLFPVVAFVLGDLFIIPNRLGSYMFRHKTQIAFWGLGLLLITNLINQSYYIFREDRPAKVAAYLEKHMDEDDVIYISGYKHIIYYLLDRSPPTPFVHPTLFAYKHHIESLDIDTKLEIGKVLKQKPEFIIYRIDNYLHTWEEYFFRKYKKMKEFDGEVFVYRQL